MDRRRAADGRRREDAVLDSAAARLQRRAAAVRDAGVRRGAYEDQLRAVGRVGQVGRMGLSSPTSPTSPTCPTCLVDPSTRSLKAIGEGPPDCVGYWTNPR